MTPTDHEIAALNRALDQLQERYGVSSDVALVRKLRQDGHKTSTHVFHKWRTGKWPDADTVLVRALIASNTPPPN